MSTTGVGTELAKLQRHIAEHFPKAKWEVKNGNTLTLWVGVNRHERVYILDDDSNEQFVLELMVGSFKAWEKKIERGDPVAVMEILFKGMKQTANSIFSFCKALTKEL
jgi:hypothetical protein